MRPVSAAPELSPLEKMALLPRDVREEIWKEEARKSDLSVDALKAQMSRSWPFLARPKQLAPAGAWVYWFVMAGRGFGKLLHDETPLPTPSGWTTMGDVRVGDALLDEAGRPTRVTWKSERQTVEAYRVAFSDGSSILACADHQWVTWDRAARKAYLRSAYEDSTRMPDDWPGWRVRRAWRRDRLPERIEDGPGPRIRTTREIASSVRGGARGDLAHSVPLTAPLDLPEADLPVDPYVLGYWLGDGTSISGQFTIHEDDQPSFFEQARAYAPRRLSDPQRVGTRGLYAALRAAGLLGAKRVPAEYLRASVAQRLALLQGLMDSDGHAVARTSNAEFASSSYDLAAAVMELATSLGQKPTLSDGPSFLAGREHRRRYRVTWRPTLPVFRLPRKASRIRPLGPQAFRSLHRMVVSVEPIGVALPMHCVAVDSPHRMYLAGEAMVPTHNTLTGAQWVRERGLERRCRVALIGPTLGDVRATMVEGETGLLSVIPNDALMGQSREVAWNKSLLQLTLANGTIMQGFSSETPDRLRGPQHHYAWGEEVSSWKDASKGAAVGSDQNTTWSNMTLGLRLGDHPRACLTSTPKANKLTRDLVKLPALTLVRGSSYENRANLSQVWWDAVVAPLAGTRTGRQEIEAELLEDVEGAIWTRMMIDLLRAEPPPPELRRVVVAVDPNTTSGETSDDAGIIIVGDGYKRDEHGQRHGYVLGDVTTTRGGPAAWASAAVRAYYEFEADRIVAEKNQGGEMVAITIKSVDPTVPVKLVNASRGKRTRAEPVAALYEPITEDGKPDGKVIRPGLIHHVGVFADLEDEMTTWTGEGESPNRMDALVWGMTELKLWTPTSQHRGGLARGRLPGTTMGDGLGDLATHRV